MSRPPPRILFLDAHDSFSNNITSLLTVLLSADVHVLAIDSPLLSLTSPDFESRFRTEISHYDAIVCGPGPGNPTNPDDVGFIGRVWDLAGEDDVPVLGICLGFQSLCSWAGAGVRRVRGGGLHGIVREVGHVGLVEMDGEVEGDIFGGVGNFKATLYHSLCVDLGQDGVENGEWERGEKWKVAEGCEGLVPLAWVEEKRDDGTERICMAVRHKSRPFWGLQYHPESVCTETEGNKVVVNWFEEAMRWNGITGRAIGNGKGLLAHQATRPSLLSQGYRSWENPSGPRGSDFRYTTVPLPEGMDVVDLVEMLDGEGEKHILLDSSNANLPAPDVEAADVRGRFSIFALDVRECTWFKHVAGRDVIQQRPQDGRNCIEVPLSDGCGSSIWSFLADYQSHRRVDPPTNLETPFMGGFMGYVTYEQGLYDIGVKLPENRGHERGDVVMYWVTKSVVVDHRKGLIHIQLLHSPGDTGSWNCDEVSRDWSEKTAEKLRRTISNWQPRNKTLDVYGGKPHGMTNGLGNKEATSSWALPDANDYQNNVKLCQEFIAAGDSYELCLTDQTEIRRKRSNSPRRKLGDMGQSCQAEVLSSWQLFKRMRARQPAPFASYLKLDDMTLVSASPERFLEYDRDGHCSMRPMKGTVRKSDAVSTLAQAESILHVPKEEAENLMIVDLVRHDMHGVCGAGNVTVRDLMKVEEYQDVYQMITVVEGRLPTPPPLKKGGRDVRYTGFDVLAASLPPGSMTGAPKKRSCEILQTIENGRERGVYSGVVGYMCASGRGDWSVTIRSLFRYDGLDEETWRIGAGGAVTALSTPEGETEEMFTKLNGPFRTINMDTLGWTGQSWE